MQFQRSLGVGMVNHITIKRGNDQKLPFLQHRPNLVYKSNSEVPVDIGHSATNIKHWRQGVNI